MGGSDLRQSTEGLWTQCVQIGLTSTHVTVLTGLHVSGLTQQQVADDLGCSQRWVSELHKQALELLAANGLSLPRQQPKPKQRLRYFDGQNLERMF